MKCIVMGPSPSRVYIGLESKERSVCISMYMPRTGMGGEGGGMNHFFSSFSSNLILNALCDS